MKIIVADDHTLMREGIELLLKESYPSVDITSVSNTDELLKQVNDHAWDMVITDISMPPGESGLEALKKIKEKSPDLPVIIMSMHAPEQYAIRAFKAGASGYLTKSGAGLELKNAVTKVLSGKKYISPEVAYLLADSIDHVHEEQTLANLSDREFEVFNLLATAKPITQIAKQLLLSTNTVSTFRSRIFAKMHFVNNLDLIKYAVKQKLV